MREVRRDNITPDHQVSGSDYLTPNWDWMSLPPADGSTAHPTSTLIAPFITWKQW